MKLRLNYSGQNLPILLLASATLLHIATTPTSCAKQQQQLATKGSASVTSNQLQSDLLTANFYSIKDGKTSARRIVQQPSFGAANSTNVRGQSLVTPGSSGGLNDEQQQLTNENQNSFSAKQELDNVELPKEETPNNEAAATLSAQNQQSGAANSATADIGRIVENGGQMNDRLPQQTTGDDSNLVQSSVAGNMAGDLNNFNQLSADGENNLMQQQMMINSFNSLVGNGALDDFVPSTTSPTVAPAASASRQQQQQQQQQQQSATNSQFMSNRGDMPVPSSTPSGDTSQQQQSQFQDSFSSTATVDSTTKLSTQFLADPSSSNGQAANKLVMQPLNQQQAQFTTSTGTPVSSPNSISMSLDGMIVNSRPRGLNQQQQQQLLDAGAISNGQTNGEKKSKQSLVPQSRIGELSGGDNSKLRGENLRNSQTDGNFDGQQNTAKASRRVPYSGVTFTSPVTKGQRTKPKASNQVGGAFGSLPQQQVGLVNGVSGPQAADLMAGLQLEAAQPSGPLGVGRATNGFRQKSTNSQQVFGGQNNQLLKDNFAQQQQDQQNEMQLLQGFDEDQQQIQQQRTSTSNINSNSNNNNANLDSNTLEVMRNIINNPTLRNQQNSRGSSPDDMVMSLMSSADGKERRLVMIARETLDSLQRFAAQNQQMGLQQQQPQQTATKSKTSQRQSNKKQSNKPAKQQQQQQSTRSSDSNGSVASWWPNNGGQNMWSPNLSTGGQQQQNSLQTSTSGPSSSSQQRDFTTQQQEAQQEVQLQTTTLAPQSFNGNALVTPTTPATTTTTTQLPVTFSSVTTTQSAFSQESSSSGSFENAKDSSQSGEIAASNGQNRAKSNGNDSFREVPVVSSIVVAKENSGLNEQQSQLQTPTRSSNGQANKAKQVLGVKSKSSGSKMAAGGDKSNGAMKQQSGLVGGGNSRSRQQSERPIGNQATSKTGGKKKQTSSNNNSSPLQAGKQSASNGKQIDGSSKENVKGSKSKSNGQSQGTKKSGSRKTTATIATNGQQQISANRASEQQQTKRPLLNLSEDFSTTPATTTTTTSSPAISSQTNSQNSPDQSSNADQQIQDQLQTTSTSKRPATTTSTTPIGSAISQQQFPTTQKSLADENEQQQQQQQQQRVQPSSNEASSDRQFEDYGSRAHSGSFDSHLSGPQTDADRIDALRAAIPGEPQLDYPIYASPPKTSFDCMSQSCPGGYYADLETQCQVFHICQNDGRFDTFLCPNGTIFSQQHFVCVWWWQVDCQQSAAFYKLNDGIYCNSMFPAATLSSSGSVGINNARGTSTLLNGTTGGGSNQIGGANNSLSSSSSDAESNNGSSSQTDSFSNRGPFNGFNSNEQANENSQSGGSNSLASSSSSTLGGSSNTASGVSTTSSSPTSSVTDSTQDDKQNQLRFRGNSSNNSKQQVSSSENLDDSEQQKQQEQQQQQQLEQLARKA